MYIRASLTWVLAGWLLTGCSQIVIVPPAPDGSSTALDVTWDKGEKEFDRRGYAFYIDRLHDVVYRISEEEIEAQFGSTLAPMRQILADGLPELPHSYATLMASDHGPLGFLSIQAGEQQPQVLDRANLGVFIDGYPDRPRLIDSTRLQQDFGPALEAQTATLDALSSYLTLLPPPDGYQDHLNYRVDDQIHTLERPGQGLTLDGIEYQAEAETLERDFAPALQRQHDILSAGLPDLAHSYAVLMPSARGELGYLAIKIDERDPVKLDQAMHGIFIDGYPDRPRNLDGEKLREDFGAAWQQQAATLKTLNSYLTLLPPPDGYQDRLTYQVQGKQLELSQPGQGLTLDGFEYQAEAHSVERDFKPALDALNEILAAGLPELPHSYVVLLKHAIGKLGELSYQSNDGATQHQLQLAANGVFIDGYPDRPRSIDSARLQRDFGPALDALSSTFKGMRSYIILLKSPDGADSKVVFRTRGNEIRLDQVGQSLTLDGLEYMADGELADADFTPARNSTQQILDEGLPKLPHSYVALIASADGPLGELEILEGINQGIILDQAASALIIDGYSSKIYALDSEQFRADFDPAIIALPLPPVTHLLFFETGSTRLTAESRATLQVILDDIRLRQSADISIAGHTDTVGGEKGNELLSRKRSEAIAALLEKSGLPIQEINLSYHGKTALAIETPDNTPELLNRRVEITIR